jgi:thiamine phosphate synthase YjbQ (UPF0047 family)
VFDHALFLPMTRVFQKELQVRAPRRGLHEITDAVAGAVGESGIAAGVASVFIRHTSASLVVQENADPTAFAIRSFLDRLVPEAALVPPPAEGPTTCPPTSVDPHQRQHHGVARGLASAPGRIYLWEHRDHATTRSIRERLGTP